MVSSEVLKTCIYAYIQKAYVYPYVQQLTVQVYLSISNGKHFHDVSSKM